MRVNALLDCARLLAAAKRSCSGHVWCDEPTHVWWTQWAMCVSFATWAEDM